MKLPFVILLFLIMSANSIVGSLRKNPNTKRYERRKEHVGIVDSAENELRIIGGQGTDIESYPYIVSVLTEYDDGEEECAGSIIKEKYILTAAHCLNNTYTTDMLIVRAGSNFREYGGNVYKVEKFVVHEDWTSEGNVSLHDVAVIKLKDPIVLSEFSQPIELFEANEPVEADSEASILGWGVTDMNQKDYVGQLRETTVPVVNQTLCEEIYGYDDVVPGTFCAGYVEEGGKDVCAGDSGGPVVIDGRQAGIVSWSKGCALPGYPAVYTDVGYFRDWIDKHVQYLNES